MIAAKQHIICLMPVYDDWDSFSILVENLETEFNSLPHNYSLEIIVVDDSSSQQFDIKSFSSKTPVEVVVLKKNVGHQRAIAAGLQYIHDTSKPFDYVVVMDSDGEDRPQDIFKLVDKCRQENNSRIIFAQRKKRQESRFFKTGYFFYRHIFYLLTGHRINFGNFSCIPSSLLKRVVIQDNLWNHYSGCIIQSRIGFGTVLSDRGNRYRGKSKMNFTNLVLHGLSSISVYFDYLSVRILKLSLYSIVVCVLAVFFILYQKLFTDTSVPGWASNLILIIFSIILQLSSVTLIVLLMQLSARKNIVVPSATVYKAFVEEIISNDIKK